jgi:hypothetical protein
MTLTFVMSCGFEHPLEQFTLSHGLEGSRPVWSHLQRKGGDRSGMDPGDLVSW